MSSFFKIVSSEQWEEAKITGLIPRCTADINADSLFVNQFDDLETVCSRFFSKFDYPVALEFSPESYSGQLEWLEPTEEKPWSEGQLKVDHLFADLVLNIYSFEVVSTTNGDQFSLQGEE